MEKENKHNKRRALYLSTGALCLALSLGVTSCSEIPCIYSGEGECSSDVCTSECTDEGDGADTDGSEGEHVHSYTVLNYDESYHWQECSCGEISGKEAHTFETISTTEGSYDYALGKALDGVKVMACSVCKYETTEPVPNENIYIHENVGESASKAAQRNLDTIESGEGTYVLTNGTYSELYLRVSSKVSADDNGTYVREVNNLTIKGDGETVVAGLVISSEYYEYDEASPTSLQGVAKTLTEEATPTGSLVINNLVIEDIAFTSSIRISGNVTINGLIVSNCSYEYPSEYRYLNSDMLVDADPSTVGLVYAVNESDTTWEDIVITGCEVVEPYYGVYIEGDASVTITDCYFSSYRLVKYLDSSGSVTKVSNSALYNSYQQMISIKPTDEGSISGDIVISDNIFQGGFYNLYTYIKVSGGPILVDGVSETGSLTVTGNTAEDIVNVDTVVATFSNITTEDFTLTGNEYVSPTMGANFSSTFDAVDDPTSTYKWKVMYADSLFTFDHEEDLLYFCNACWNNNTTLDHASHLDHYHGHTDGASASKDFDAEWDEVNHAMILANYYASPYMSFYLDFMDFSQHDYMVSFDLDFSSFTAENGEYVSMACCFAHGNYSAMDVEVGYDSTRVEDGLTGFYVTAKAWDSTENGWKTVTHHEADGKVHIEMNFSKDSNGDSTGYFTVNVYEGDYEHKGDLVATISSVHTSVGTNCIQWCPDAGHGVDTDHDGTDDHYGYTEDGDYVEIDNFGFTLLENNTSRAVSA